MQRTLTSVAILLGAAVAAAHGDQRHFALDGTVKSGAGTRAATLRVLCEPSSDGGAISLELWVPEAFKRKDFDYDDFEGPDAVAGGRALSRCTASGPGSHLEIVAAAAGWYSGEDPDTFVFGVSQPSHQKGQVASLLQGIASTTAQLVWVQSAFAAHTDALRATFALDAAGAQQLRATVAPCLAPAAPAKAHGKP